MSRRRPRGSVGGRSGPPEASPHHHEDPALARMAFFSDGVFAIAITLLILAIRIPRPDEPDADRGLLALLAQQWRSYLAYVLSVIQVGVNWVNHRAMLAAFARADRALLWLNLLYLTVAVAFIPVPTAVLGAWLGSPGNEVVAAVFYGVAAALGAVAYNAVWLYGAYVGKLTVPTLGPHERRAHTIAWGASPLVLVAFTAIAFVRPTLAVIGLLAVILAYVLPIPRLVALLRRRRPRR